MRHVITRRHALQGLAAGATLAASPWARAANPRILTIGTVDEDLAAEEATFAPLCRYLERKLARLGVDEVRLLGQTSIGAIADAFDRDEVDLYLDSPILTALVARAGDAEAFLRSWKEGVAEYNTLIYTRADAPVQRLADLRGRVVAFKKRESTPGFFLPRAEFAREGVPMVQLESADQPVPADRVGYVFSHGDQTTLGWVMMGRVAAGVMKNDMLTAPELSGVRQRLRVVAETPMVPRQVLMRRADMRPTLVAALHETLTTMHEDADGMAALARLDGTARFDRLAKPGNAAFEEIWRMLDMLEASAEPAS